MPTAAGSFGAVSWLPSWRRKLCRRQTDPLPHLRRQQDAGDVRLADDVRLCVAPKIFWRLLRHHVGVAVKIFESRHGPPKAKLVREAGRALEIEHRVDNAVLLREL